MTRNRSHGWRAFGALVLPITLFFAACGGDDDDDDATGDDTEESADGEDGDLAGTTVTIFGPEVEQELQGFSDSFTDFEEETGITVEIQGDRGFEQQIGVRVDGGDPPDIAMFPQPGKIRDFADDLKPLPDNVLSLVEENFTPAFTDFVDIDGTIRAVPAKADLKSLVWYSPAAFEEAGYEIPETQEELRDLADTMIADGNTPFCLGLGSDEATGWPLTDWIEDTMLRMKGPDVYDQWYQHEIPFNDPDVVEVGQYVDDFLSTPGMVFGDLENSPSTTFQDAGLPLLDGDCMMHRQGNFYVANWPEGTTFGEDGDVNTFYFPTFEDSEFQNVILGGGIYAAPFADRPEVMKTLEFIASTDFANARASQPVGGFLSPNINVDRSAYQRPIEGGAFSDTLADAETLRFDASDLMPGGGQDFWSAVVNIATGTDVETAFTEVEDSWPTE